MSQKFNVEKQAIEELSILSIEGFLDAHTAPILEKEIDDLVENKNFKIIIDFSKLEYISSAGLGVFMSQIEHIRNNGGDLKLTEMQEKVFSVFDLLGFPMLFDVTQKKDDAINNFKNQLENNG
jgi:anti-sigma B factor antagonist